MKTKTFNILLFGGGIIIMVALSATLGMVDATLPWYFKALTYLSVPVSAVLWLLSLQVINRIVLRVSYIKRLEKADVARAEQEIEQWGKVPTETEYNTRRQAVKFLILQEQKRNNISDLEFNIDMLKSTVMSEMKDLDGMGELMIRYKEENKIPMPENPIMPNGTATATSIDPSSPGPVSADGTASFF